MATKINPNAATLYRPLAFGFGYCMTEIVLIDHGYRPYAQYEKAAFVKFKKKRGSKVFGVIEGYDPRYLILKGWGHFEPENQLKAGKSVTSFDPAIDADFKAAVRDYLALNPDVSVIFDTNNIAGVTA